MTDERDPQGRWPLGILRDGLGDPRPGVAQARGRRGAPAGGGGASAGRSTRRRAPRGPVGPERAGDPGACREVALRLLERTRRTRSDLTRKLREKGYDAAVIEAVIERLAAVGLVDDVEFALAFLAGRWGRRASGWRVLENDLRRRGVSKEDIAAARARFEIERGGVDELAGALRAIGQASRRYAQLDPQVRRRRLWGMLARKGFDGDTIEAALRVAGSARIAPDDRD